MSNDRIIKTYVWHGGTCFFVSTIERDSSAALAMSRYNETMAWEYDWEKRERGQFFIYHADAPLGSIRAHQAVVESLFTTGKPEKGTDE